MNNPTVPADLAAVQALDRHLLAAATATYALAAWCETHGIGTGLVKAIVKRTGQKKLPDDELFDALAMAPQEGLRHREVTLIRGDAALSDCDLWWLPSRLEAPISLALDATDTPFGEVISPLRPSRRTVFTRVMPAGGEHILEHRAVVLAGLDARRPVAAVRELYRTTLITTPHATPTRRDRHAEPRGDPAV